MFEVEAVVSEHKDVIHDVAYDFYSTRMATCSSDQMVNVMDQDESGKWVVSSSWKAHSSSVWRLSWAHPEFGQLLATCSFDRTVSLWEEVVGEKVATSAPTKRWVKRATFSDSRTSITDLEFAPKYLGLMLATASADGIIRIYEAPDFLNLTQWTLQHEIANKQPLSCLSWNTSQYLLFGQLLAAGSDETATSSGKVFIYAYSENARKYSKVETINELTEPVSDVAFAPNCGRSFHMLAVATKDLYIVNIRGASDNSGSAKLDLDITKFTEHNCPVWRISWNILGTGFISSGDDGTVRVWRMNFLKVWKCVAVLKSDVNSPTYEPNPSSPSNPNSAAGTAKYYKKGIISNPNLVPWH